MLQQAHLHINHIIKTNHAELIPSIASLGVLNPNPTLFQNLFPPFPGLFPFPDFFELRNAIYHQNLSKYDTSISNFSLYIYSQTKSAPNKIAEKIYFLFTKLSKTPFPILDNPTNSNEILISLIFLSFVFRSNKRRTDMGLLKRKFKFLPEEHLGLLQECLLRLQCT